MPPQDLPPGLYDHPLSEAEHQALGAQLASLHQLEPLDPAEAPQRLARYLRQLSEIALAALPEAQRQQQQLALVNRIVAVLQEQAPKNDQLRRSAPPQRPFAAGVAGRSVAAWPGGHHPAPDSPGGWHPADQCPQ